MKFISDRLIEVDRELSTLDEFVLSFTRILDAHHIQHVIVSGYVSILLGRSRVSEDIDLLVQPITREDFALFYDNVKKEGFYCLNADSKDEVFSYLEEALAIRFARVDTVIPNIEFKFVKNAVDNIALRKRVTVILNRQHELYISPLELQIAYKEVKLGSPKDIEDALHLRTVAEGFIQEEEIEAYKEMLSDHDG